jgi:hypothetical protein
MKLIMALLLSHLVATPVLADGVCLLAPANAGTPIAPHAAGTPVQPPATIALSGACPTCGVNWTGRTAAEANYWRFITYGNGIFVAVADAVANGGSHRVMTSPEGITWTAQSAAEANSWEAVTYGNGTFVAVALDGHTG